MQLYRAHTTKEFEAQRLSWNESPLFALAHNAKGRTVSIHPDEALMQELRERQWSDNVQRIKHLPPRSHRSFYNSQWGSRGILSLVLPPLKTGRATFTASGFQKSLGCQVVSLLVAVEMEVF